MSILSNTLKGLIEINRRKVSVRETGLIPEGGVLQQEGGSIICFSAGSEGDALANLTREVILPVANRSSKIWLLNVNDKNWQLELKQALKDPMWFAFSFFGVGQEINIEYTGSLKNFWETFKIPFVRVFGDIPAYFPDRHLANYSNSINMYGDKSHAEFYRRWFDKRALSALLTSLPMGSKPLTEVDKFLKLKGSIIFPKNGNSPQAQIDYWRMSLPNSTARVLESVAEECISQCTINSNHRFDELIARHYNELGIDIAANRALLCFLVAQIDDYVRRVKSTMITEAILDLPVIIRGVNWGHVDFYGKRARLEVNSDYASTSNLLDASLALIDMSPNTVHAPHDRVCRAAGRGTAFLTNQQEFLQKTGINVENCTFSFDKNSIHNLVEYYIINPSHAIDMGIRQATFFQNYYTNEKYAECLLSSVETMALRLSGRPSGTQNFVDFPPKMYD